MSLVDNAALPEGSLVLVTGANGMLHCSTFALSVRRLTESTGYVASHVVEQLLLAGYRVRGTTRSLAKIELLKERWDERYPDQFEVAQVEDIVAKGAFDEAIKGCAGVAHVASSTTFSTDLDQVLPVAVDGTLNVLRAAAATPSVKRFVLTSSIVAIGNPASPTKLGSDVFNYGSIEAAKSMSNDDPRKGHTVYSSSKTQAELAAWKFVRESKASRPSFVFNVVCPAFCLGEMFDTQHSNHSSAGIMKSFFLSESDEPLRAFADIEFVSVSDVALLHVGALLLPEIADKRLVGSAVAGNWNEVLSIFRRRFPSRSFYPPVAPATAATAATLQCSVDADESIYETGDSLYVVHRLGKQDGWTGLEEALVQTVSSFALVV
ncbi:hypothetical protein JCM11491_002261 [Sporobolomyces phaffii]